MFSNEFVVSKISHFKVSLKAKFHTGVKDKMAHHINHNFHLQKQSCIYCLTQTTWQAMKGPTWKQQQHKRELRRMQLTDFFRNPLPCKRAGPEKTGLTSNLRLANLNGSKCRMVFFSHTWNRHELSRGRRSSSDCSIAHWKCPLGCLRQNCAQVNRNRVEYERVHPNPN